MSELLDLFLIGLLLLLPILILAKRKNILGEFLLGMVFGGVWESITKGIIYTFDITALSVIVIITWGIIFASTTYYAEAIKREWGFRSYLIPDIMSSVWGLAFEIISFKIFQVGNYNDDVTGEGAIPILELPYLILVGWPLLVIIYNNFIRIFDPIIEGWMEKRYNLRMKIGRE